jgi:hypothetical protein
MGAKFVKPIPLEGALGTPLSSASTSKSALAIKSTGAGTGKGAIGGDGSAASEADVAALKKTLTAISRALIGLDLVTIRAKMLQVTQSSHNLHAKTSPLYFLSIHDIRRYAQDFAARAGLRWTALLTALDCASLARLRCSR